MNKFNAEYTNEAIEQYKKLNKISKRKIATAIAIFEQVGTDYKNINFLGNELYELKPDNVRVYFKYAKGCIIIIGLLVLKKTQKAPKRYIELAHKNIDKYLQENKELKL